MSSTGFRRVVVALDASPSGRAVVEAAAALAAAAGAPLVGVFVEDLELLELGLVPAAHHADALSARVAPAERPELERQLRAQARRARATLERTAAELALAWTFSVARGRVAAELLAAAGPEDLLALGRVGHGRGRGERLGRTAREVLAHRTGPLLLVAVGGRRAASPIVLRWSEVARTRAELERLLATLEGPVLLVS
jgi:nucleotide-binding universal stress UspA family protein